LSAPASNSEPNAPVRFRVGRWLREPLLHFLVAGAALFGLYAWLNPSAFEQPADSRIVITEDDLNGCIAAGSRNVVR